MGIVIVIGIGIAVWIGYELYEAPTYDNVESRGEDSNLFRRYEEGEVE